MPNSSECDSAYGHEDFDHSRLSEEPRTRCPISGCSTELGKVRYTKKTERPYCAEHGLRLHSNTFVYYNGDTKEDKHRAHLRNFAFEKKLASGVLDSTTKAEKHRLGFEMSEDALSWNVFVALSKARKLRETVKYLTGRAIAEEPELYLWGYRFEDSAPFEPLGQLRKLLERDIGRFKTEPDVILVIPRKFVISIEAKFGSGNPLDTRSGSVKPGEKPTDIGGLLRQYLGKVGDWSQESKCIRREAITGRLHSQLFRNVVFAARMAEKVGAEADWHVVNLVSSTQWELKSAKEAKFRDPSATVRSYLVDTSLDCFTFRTWEGLYQEVVKPAPDLQDLQRYFRGKSAHFRPAFAID